MVKLFSKNSNLCDHNSSTSQTDRQTDRQTTCDRNTALCTKVHRAVKMLSDVDRFCQCSFDVVQRRILDHTVFGMINRTIKYKERDQKDSNVRCHTLKFEKLGCVIKQEVLLTQSGRTPE